MVLLFRLSLSTRCKQPFVLMCRSRCSLTLLSTKDKSQILKSTLTDLFSKPAKFEVYIIIEYIIIIIEYIIHISWVHRNLLNTSSLYAWPRAGLWALVNTQCFSLNIHVIKISFPENYQLFTPVKWCMVQTEDLLACALAPPK